MVSAGDERPDEHYMEAALNEARQGLSVGEVPVGCVLVYEGHILGGAHNLTNVTGNATAHAEINALRALDGTYEELSLTMYVTCEPCVMCAAAIVHVRTIKRVVYGCVNGRFGGCGTVRDIRALAKDTKFVPMLIDGVLEEQCVRLLEQFYERENPFAPEPKKKRKRARTQQLVSSPEDAKD